VQKVGGRLHSLELAARAPSGRSLSIDIGWLGSETPQYALIHSSGTHGVEGFAGSAIQLQLLDRLPPVSDNTALIFVHVLNPFGMAWFRRTNENNVDLNRNFLSDGQYSGCPPGYARVDSFLSPKTKPSHDFFLMKSMLMIRRFGLKPLVQAIGGGQYEYPQGLFYGGRKLEEGPEKYHAFLRERLSTARGSLAIDVHTGIGRFGRDMLIVERNHYESLRRVFGKRVTLSEPEHGPAYRIRGGLSNLLSNALPAAGFRFMAQEFGTYNPIKVLHRLREENRWHHFGAGSLDHSTKRELKEAFCPSSKQWRDRVLSRGRAVVELGLETLRRSQFF
jgi:hypothetical protein